MLKKELSNLLSGFEIKNHRVAVITPPLYAPNNIDPNSVRAKAYPLHLPLGQLYICEAVDQLGNWDSVPFDLNFMMLKNAATGKEHSLECLVDSIPSDFDAYLIGCMFSTSNEVYKKIFHLLKKRDKLRVAGGVNATGCYKDFLSENCAEIVIKYEGEYQIANFLNFWDGKAEVDLNNLSFLSDNNEIISFVDHHDKVESYNIVKQFTKIKDNIPEYGEYGSLGHFARALVKDRRSATILANRGCRGSCSFCSVRNFMGKGVRIFDENTMIKTIKYLYNECGITHMDLLDDDFLADRDKAISLLNKITDLDYDLVFTNTNAALARNINEELVDAIAQAGFIQFGFGVETGNEEMRKHIRKTTNLKNLEETIEIFNKKYSNIFIHCNFMIGFPGETVGQILDTFNYAKNLNVDWCQVAVVQALPNTPMWDEFVALNDPRISKSQKYSPASEAKHKGVSLDEIGLNVVDVFSLPHEKVLTFNELNSIWYPINTRLNFLENKNLDAFGQIWKLENFNHALLECYPNDPIMLLTASECYHKKKEIPNAIKYQQLAGEIINNSKFWKNLLVYLKKYDKHNIIPNSFVSKK